ncbi:hypothetical protein NE237_031394 [Protea cynaroides]|uniref:Uncharacterized protein n=1 Tax=Protea cynaroides TaxID=273540 RepID=A0A9Q0L140_9MAGN|nr:hypothetical protein NE237_031394 [Protea cynaroides]
MYKHFNYYTPLTWPISEILTLIKGNRKLQNPDTVITNPRKGYYGQFIASSRGYEPSSLRRRKEKTQEKKEEIGLEEAIKKESNSQRSTGKKLGVILDHLPRKASLAIAETSVTRTSQAVLTEEKWSARHCFLVKADLVRPRRLTRIISLRLATEDVLHPFRNLQENNGILGLDFDIHTILGRLKTRNTST